MSGAVIVGTLAAVHALGVVNAIDVGDEPDLPTSEKGDDNLRAVSDVPAPATVWADAGNDDAGGDDELFDTIGFTTFPDMMESMLNSDEDGRILASVLHWKPFALIVIIPTSQFLQ